MSAWLLDPQMGCGLLDGYAVASASLTSPIILMGSVGQTYEAAEKVALLRIKMTAIGVLVSLVVQSILWPQSAQVSLSLDSMPPSIKS